jgi:hypothetical protein
MTPGPAHFCEVSLTCLFLEGRTKPSTDLLHTGLSPGHVATSQKGREWPSHLLVSAAVPPGPVAAAPCSGRGWGWTAGGLDLRSLSPGQGSFCCS